MHDNYFNLHKSIINNCLRKNFPNIHYNLSHMCEQAYPIMMKLECQTYTYYQQKKLLTIIDK
jgi:hypothetical protein